eukprot:gb/GECG01010379.1/.p1 GENE.gb/GECG01010379.1/~~gb/GECG01010379.1/.p1  ORF type:complete len:968 (+),score=79.04 gb/GECG01010379.1/:1-2904(+)
MRHAQCKNARNMSGLLLSGKTVMYSAEMGPKEGMFFCRNSITKSFVSSSNCEDDRRPPEMKPCFQPPCTLYEWRASEWRRCTRICGGGERFRNVYCTNTVTAKVVNETLCQIHASSAKPAMNKACNNRDCSLVEWSIGKWSDCHGTCGYNNATKYRDVKCLFSNDGDLANATLCAGIPHPTTEEHCLPSHCDFCDSLRCVHGNCTYDEASGPLCQCEENWRGEFCDQHEIPCTLEGGVLTANGSCCMSSVLDSEGLCCNSSSPEIAPVRDRNGACCPGGQSALDVCDVCDGGAKVVDRYGKCCEGVLSADQTCCPSGILDACGVCDGDGASCECSISATLLMNSSVISAREMDSVLSRSGPDYTLFIDNMEERATAVLELPREEVEIRNINEIATRKNGTKLLLDFRIGPRMDHNTPVDSCIGVKRALEDPFDGILGTFSDGLCGNGVCESGEMCDEQSGGKCCRSDCGSPLKECPSASNSVECSGRGVCVASSGFCSCDDGYQGDSCTECAAGYTRLSAARQYPAKCIPNTRTNLAPNGPRSIPTSTTSPTATSSGTGTATSTASSSRSAKPSPSSTNRKEGDIERDSRSSDQSSDETMSVIVLVSISGFVAAICLLLALYLWKARARSQRKLPKTGKHTHQHHAIKAFMYSNPLPHRANVFAGDAKSGVQATPAEAAVGDHKGIPSLDDTKMSVNGQGSDISPEGKHLRSASIEEQRELTGRSRRQLRSKNEFSQMRSQSSRRKRVRLGSNNQSLGNMHSSSTEKNLQSSESSRSIDPESERKDLMNDLAGRSRRDIRKKNQFPQMYPQSTQDLMNSGHNDIGVSPDELLRGRSLSVKQSRGRMVSSEALEAEVPVRLNPMQERKKIAYESCHLSRRRRLVKTEFQQTSSRVPIESSQDAHASKKVTLGNIGDTRQFNPADNPLRVVDFQAIRQFGSTGARSVGRRRRRNRDQGSWKRETLESVV